MELQTLLEDYLALLKRENERLHADVAALRQEASLTDRERGRSEADIIKRNTLLWRLAIWDPSEGESKVHQAFRRLIKAGASYEDVDGIVEAVYHSIRFPEDESKDNGEA